MSVIGPQLTALTASCQYLDVALIYTTCKALRHLILEGEECQAPLNAVESFKHTALTRLQGVKIKCFLPTAYTDVIFTNAHALTDMEIVFLREVRPREIRSR